MGNVFVFFFIEFFKVVCCIFRFVFFIIRMFLKFSCSYIYLYLIFGDGVDGGGVKLEE